MKNNVTIWTSISVMSLMFAGLLLPSMQGYSATSGFNFPDFSSPTMLELNSDAAVVNNALRLTPSVDWNAGSAWFAEKQPVANGFETVFNFQTTQLAGIDDFCIPGHIGADEIVFVVQNVASGTGSVGGEDLGIG